jgi:flavin-binding protein dodecin
MSVYKMTEIVGTSKENFADATRIAIERASQTIRNIGWFEVKEERGLVKDGKVSEFQVKLSIGFRLDDAG